MAAGPVLARLAIHGTTSDIKHQTFITIYADIDRVDFDFRIDKPVTTREQRLCHVFPVLRPQAILRAETTGVVVRPYPQPKGDLLPGADPNRFAIQGFVDASVDGGLGITIVPVEAFVLRLDLDPLSFEALGNDQNYQESTRDQNGETQFRFRYSLRAQAKGWQGASAANFSRSVTSPLIVAAGGISVCACGNAGTSGPLTIAVPGYRRAIETDLLERDKAELAIANGELAIQLGGHEFACVRLFPA